MAIEFRCRQCGRLLRVPDDAAGKSAQCPECQGLTTVPLGGLDYSLPPPSGQPSSRQPSEFDLSESSSAPPFAKAGNEIPRSPRSSQQFGGNRPAAENPYQAPSLASEHLTPGAVWAAQEANTPALIIMILAGIDLALSALAGVTLLLFGALAPAQAVQGLPEIGVNLVTAVISLVVNSVIILGMLNMRQLTNYSLAMTASVLALLPCFHCCLIKLPFAIWALIVLSKIRPYFKS